jgi:hypothetical protein
MRLLVFTPTWIDENSGEDAITPEVETAIKGQVLRDNLDFDWHVTADNPYPIGDLRNVLHQYQRAREWFLQHSDHYDALLTVEHDCIMVDPDTLIKLLETPGDIIYAPYLLRGLHLLSAFRYPGQRPLTAHDSLSYYADELRQAREAKIWRVSGAGFGCTLMRRHVLEAVEFLPHDNLAEWCPDLRFAEDADRAGFESYARFDLPIVHLDRGERLLPFTRRELRQMARQANENRIA